MAATASAAHVALVVDLSAGTGLAANGKSILPFLQLPRELRDQVRPRLQTQLPKQHIPTSYQRSSGKQALRES